MNTLAPPVLLLWYEKPEWWLVIVGSVTLFLIWWQAKKTAEATQAMRESLPLQKSAADAALLNAQALINAERPLVMIEFEKVMHTDHPGKASFRIFAVNRGKSIARIVSRPEAVEVACVMPDSELKIPYPTNQFITRPEMFLAPGVPMEIAVFNPHSEDNKRRLHSAGESQGGNIAAQRLVIYGEVKYSDGVSQEPKWSRFCYQFLRGPKFSDIGGSLIFCGPLEYNDYT